MKNQEIDSYCKIYVHVNLSLQELIELTAKEFDGHVEMYTVVTPLFEIHIDKNDWFDEAKSEVFPDGFLHFRYELDVFPQPSQLQKEHIHWLSRFLTSLWSKNIPAVAACDYEEFLPCKGGYKDGTIPWLGADNPLPDLEM